ncbi:MULTISPECIES: DNA topoisomerase (ATP-hydrolyzing) subunit A [unclassified Oceanispirochaeta]|uniref:DNA topoisomerase (ATP-hydrolyzing) subunit A n=1 Tax=unclassified Oceanispirochaeta TaxID=2635722 RepID=UPI000E090C47|nr:DNA topoisomerase (ATP-hydrolyzing) subunit A [Oceanispirochaeta sp. M1]MBF9015232.1 DNA topoisomerase (ATP-hydrolyzing) subunit A [Oceanispirochaeta sp. M2]NPD71690.1 DNA topoisomerase (ATP-hydrolyzing) subunit A [Oceanispirochaeta sp. M1]RDG32885.1 DNA topoisomerase (ATP-hydrolyzing) subunit A [Oceanispirochaeta sp. M1]
MQDNFGKILPIAIEDEVKESYLNYAMSVIVSRALPDVRDGLKPVHRRILYSMSEMGIRYNTAYKKCGRIVGDVLGKFHPHGDQSIYDALVRMAQDFSLRTPVVQGQGNFGSVDGDPPAAMRYTEARLAKVSEAILMDIKKDTIDFGPNYDDSMKEPLILPSAFPMLLVNGASGIAVGMATNMPPHNLKEICEAISAVIDNSEIEMEELLDIVKGPDFPTAGVVFGRTGFRQASMTGRGKITVRARYNLEEMTAEKDAIIITELPYMVNKANLVIRIAELVREKKIEGISDLRDESDRTGMRVVIELKRNVSPKVVLNLLFTHTNLQVNFNVNNLALVNGMPKVCNLRNLLDYFISHRQIVIRRRSEYELRKARARAHILVGLKKALENIDEIVEIIKKSANVNMARANLMERFDFSEIQAQAILDMRLQKLTSLETQKILDELAEIMKFIDYLEDLLAHEEKILDVVKEETAEVSEKYGDERRTEIRLEEIGSMNMEDFIEKEDMVVLISNRGFIKRVPLSAYKEQGRGGKGSNSASLKDGDFIEHIFLANTHSYILFVTSAGKAYWLKVYEIPEGSRASRGKHLKTMFEFEPDEEITTQVQLEEFSEDNFLFMATQKGVVKRVSTYDFRNAKTRGIIAINLDEEDHLVSAELTDGTRDIMIITKNGKGLRFPEDSVRCMGRNSHGVRGIRLNGDDILIGVACVSEENQLFLISENGYGKRTQFSEFNPHGRGTQGQKAYNVNEKSGKLVSVMSVNETDSLICISTLGKTIKLNLDGISIIGRNAFGVRIVNISDKDTLVGVAVQQKEEDVDEESELDSSEQSEVIETVSVEQETVITEPSDSEDVSRETEE